MAQNLTTPFLIATRPKRLDWVKLFTAEPYKVKGADPNRKNFQADWILEKDDLDLQQMVIIATDLLQKVAANRKQPLQGLEPHKDFHWPFLSGEAVIMKAKHSFMKNGREWKEEFGTHLIGKVVLKTTAQEDYPPILIIPVEQFSNSGPVLRFQQLDDPTARAAAASKFYRGMMALGKVAFKAYDTSQTSWGVTAFVNEVVATGKGERIGGAQADVAAYGRPEVAGVITSFNPTVPEPSAGHPVTW